jgi:ADP-ribosylglycohydrolase
MGCLFGQFIGDALGAPLEFKFKIDKISLQKALEMKLCGVFGTNPG